MAATESPPRPDDETSRRTARRDVRLADRLFRATTQGSGIVVMVLIVAIGAFLVWKAIPAFDRAGGRFFTEKVRYPDAEPPTFGGAALASGTLLSSLLAMATPTPVAVGTALVLTEVLPRHLATGVGWLVDLLAAVPSVVYGLWGLYFLVPRMIPFEKWLDHHLGFLPGFDSRNDTFGKSVFVAAVILAVMVLPIVAAISREVFRQVPHVHREAALALGATRWEVIRTAVLPPSRGGIVAAVMLGLGRALGETIAVALVLGAAYDINVHVLEPGGNTIAANIALKFGEAASLGRAALVASGLMLFAITLVVNVSARAIVRATTFGDDR
jgi:phosphate transport system permease protein